MNFVATLVNHKILVAEQRQNGLVKAWALWEELYPGKPFEGDLTGLETVFLILGQEFRFP